MHQGDLTTLVHLAGFVTGFALYAMLGVMALRASPRRADRIAVATSALGLLWNTGALYVYGLRDLGPATPPPWLTAVAFSALGFLPAVMVHAAARRIVPPLVAASYLISAVAAALQFASAVGGGAAPSRAALLTLTVGYAAVVGALAIAMRKQPGWRRALSVVGLAAFAVMALHQSQQTPDRSAWWVELLGHHASIPLAVAILYQDYRFALADLFLKRALTIVALTAGVTVLYVGVAEPYLLPRIAADADDPRAAALLVLFVVAIALVYPSLRYVVHRFVDRVLLRRPNYRELRQSIARQIETLDRVDDVLDAVCAALAPALWARRVTWSTTAGDAIADTNVSSVRVPTAEAPAYVITIGELRGGRRLLSDDLHLVENATLAAARRIDAIRFANERLSRELREREAMQLATEAELRALRAQLNPHFLFNTLTTIGHLMREAPERALETLYRLTGLLRAVLKKSSGEFTTLGEEMAIVEAYLGIERARFEERLGATIDVPPELASVRVPPLVLQPLVENAIKHGISPHALGGRVSVTARVEDATLRLTVLDSGGVASAVELERARRTGVGLANIERRLERYYGNRATLTLRRTSDRQTLAEVRLPVG